MSHYDPCGTAVTETYMLNEAAAYRQVGLAMVKAEAALEETIILYGTLQETLIKTRREVGAAFIHGQELFTHLGSTITYLANARQEAAKTHERAAILRERRLNKQTAMEGDCCNKDSVVGPLLMVDDAQAMGS